MPRRLLSSIRFGPRDFQAAKVRISVSLFFSTDSRHLKVAIELMMLIITISELKHSLFMIRPSMKLSVEFNLI
jgi:hypothetical protein